MNESTPIVTSAEMLQTIDQLAAENAGLRLQRDAAMASFEREKEAYESAEKDLKTQTEVSEIYAVTIDNFMKERVGLLEKVKRFREALQFFAAHTEGHAKEVAEQALSETGGDK
jgi:hypothetical protein